MQVLTIIMNAHFACRDYVYVAMQMCYIVRHQLPWQLCNYNTDMYVTLYNYVFGMVMIM